MVTAGQRLAVHQTPCGPRLDKGSGANSYVPGGTMFAVADGVGDGPRCGALPA
jgi:hypothetical protein